MNHTSILSCVKKKMEIWQIWRTLCMLRMFRYLSSMFIVGCNHTLMIMDSSQKLVSSYHIPSSQLC
jgi:hypothetical protein